MSAADASLPAGLAHPARPWSGRLDRAVAVACLLGVCFVLALLPRLVGLGTTLTSDEGYWMQRTVAFGAALTRGDLKSTYRSGHPGVTVTWIGLLGIGPGRAASFRPSQYLRLEELQRTPGYLQMMAAARRATAIVSGVLTVAIVALAWRLLGPGPSAVGGLLLLLDPYVIGSSQLLHVDTLLAPLMTLSALAGLVYWIRDAHPAYLALSAGAGGLALLTKAPAACLPIYFGLVGLATAGSWRSGRSRLGTLLVWGGVAALVYAALWPALWVEPLRRLGQVAAFALNVGGSPHVWSNFFLGRIVVDDPGWLYYPVALAFRLGPVVLLGLLGLILALRARHARTAPVLWLLAYVALFIGLMTIGPKKFDRYMLPAIIVLDLLAGLGLWTVARRLGSVHRAGGALAVAAFAQSLLLWQAHPYPIAFYNPLLGGAAGAERAIMLGWGEGLEQSAAYLNAQPDAERLVASTHYHHVLRPMFRGTTVRTGEYLSERGDDARALQPDYFVLYVNMAQRDLVPTGVRRVMAAGPPVHTAFVHGVEYARVYRVPVGLELGPPSAPGVSDEPEEE